MGLGAPYSRIAPYSERVGPFDREDEEVSGEEAMFVERLVLDNPSTELVADPWAREQICVFWFRAVRALGGRACNSWGGLGGITGVCGWVSMQKFSFHTERTSLESETALLIAPRPEGIRGQQRKLSKV